jgi:hypothetical protein
MRHQLKITDIPRRPKAWHSTICVPQRLMHYNAAVAFSPASSALQSTACFLNFAVSRNISLEEAWVCKRFTKKRAPGAGRW